MTVATHELAALIERARRHEPGAVSQLVSVFEDQRPDAIRTRAEVIAQLDAAPRRPAVVIGITGTPGSGKSTLVSRLTERLTQVDDTLTLAVVAVDPSSHVSGGALLGDRTRMRPRGTDARVFFRSQASATELGGLGPSSFQVCRLLARLYDLVLVETVGIGQSEIDVRHLADRVELVLQPLGGDEIQFLKAGIIEVPDGFVLNKVDQPQAVDSERHLRASLWLARPFDADEVPIHRTSALTGEGIDELVAAFRRVVAAGPAAGVGGAGGAGGALDDRAPHFLARWVEEEWGRVGRRFLDDQLGGATRYLADAGGYDQAQLGFSDRLRAAEHLPPSTRQEPR
ncbi:protein kinase [Nitriliruptoraceae bacterium ZYF776]|nr:protein kinase [Profundirhabdus halotolerans]